MNFTKSYITTLGGDKVNGDRVRVTEKVELNERAQRRIISKLLQGEFITLSEKGLWNKVKEVGDVVEYEEKTEHIKTGDI